MKLGKAFKLARSRRNLTQKDLAERLGVSENYLSLLENDRRDPSWSFICRLCEDLQIPIPLLLFLATENPTELPKIESVIAKELMSLLIGRKKDENKD